MTGAVFIGSEVYRGSSYGAHHPLRVPRVSTVIDLARALGWLGGGVYRSSPRARPEAVTRWHDPAYVAALRQAEAEGAVSAETRARHHLGTPSNPVFAQMWTRPATSAGGVLLAADLVAAGGVVHVPGGGTHHGMPDRAAGFCYLNDAVLGILALRSRGLRRIAYVDLDAHHGDGVEFAFAADPEVLLVSVHEERRWPFTGRIEDAGCGNAFNLPVPAALNDTEAAAIRERLIVPRVGAFAPEALVIQCGADALAEDPLSRLSLSNRAYLATLAALLPLAPRVIVLGGGGYNPWSVARLWTAVWGMLAGQALPERLPPEAEAVLRALAPEHAPRIGGHRAPVPEAWVTTLLDAPREGPLRAEVSARLDRLAARR
ncbi:MAG: acetoin utilization protein AcuC [Gemmobacter sp.]